MDPEFLDAVGYILSVVLRILAASACYPRILSASTMSSLRNVSSSLEREGGEGADSTPV